MRFGRFRRKPKISYEDQVRIDLIQTLAEADSLRREIHRLRLDNRKLENRLYESHREVTKLRLML